MRDVVQLVCRLSALACRAFSPDLIMKDCAINLNSTYVVVTASSELLNFYEN